MTTVNAAAPPMIVRAERFFNDELLSRCAADFGPPQGDGGEISRLPVERWAAERVFLPKRRRNTRQIRKNWWRRRESKYVERVEITLVVDALQPSRVVRLRRSPAEHR
jgi:hypothetical protein